MEATEKTERVELVPTTETKFDLGAVEDPGRAIAAAERLVQIVAERCQGPHYIVQISGRRYPRVEWWTTVGMALGLFPREELCERLEREGEIAYQATVGVYHGERLVTRASALCSSRETYWGSAQEYAVRSMAVTRATGKAYRIGLSFLAVMAGLEPTPAEEMPAGLEAQGETDGGLDDEVQFGKHRGRTWRHVVEEDPEYAAWAVEHARQLSRDQRAVLRAALAGEGGERRSASLDPAEAWKALAAEERILPDDLERYARVHPRLPDRVSDWTAAHYLIAVEEVRRHGWGGILARVAEAESRQSRPKGLARGGGQSQIPAALAKEIDDTVRAANDLGVLTAQDLARLDEAAESGETKAVQLELAQLQSRIYHAKSRKSA